MQTDYESLCFNGTIKTLMLNNQGSMFSKNDHLISQDTLFRPRSPFRFATARYGKVYQCPISYFRVVDRLGVGLGPKIQLIRGGLQKNHIVVSIVSSHNAPLSVNIYVGCNNKNKVKVEMKPETIDVLTSWAKFENEVSSTCPKSSKKCDVKYITSDKRIKLKSAAFHKALHVGNFKAKIDVDSIEEERTYLKVTAGVSVTAESIEHDGSILKKEIDFKCPKAPSCSVKSIKLANGIELKVGDDFDVKTTGKIIIKIAAFDETKHLGEYKATFDAGGVDVEKPILTVTKKEVSVTADLIQHDGTAFLEKEIDYKCPKTDPNCSVKSIKVNNGVELKIGKDFDVATPGKIKLKFSAFDETKHLGDYRATFVVSGADVEKSILKVKKEVSVTADSVEHNGTASLEKEIDFKCPKSDLNCTVKSIKVNGVELKVGDDFEVVTPGKIKIKIAIFDETKHLGDYKATFVVSGADVEKHILSVTKARPPVSLESTEAGLTVTRFVESLVAGASYNNDAAYKCRACELTDVYCNGEPAGEPLVTIDKKNKKVFFKIDKFTDDNSLVCLGAFKIGESYNPGILAVIDTDGIKLTDAEIAHLDAKDAVNPEIKFECTNCKVKSVMMDGVELDDDQYDATSSKSIKLLIPKVKWENVGWYQATFEVAGEHVTKNILEIKGPAGSRRINYILRN